MTTMTTTRETVMSVDKDYAQIGRENVARIKYDERVQGVKNRFYSVRARRQRLDLALMRITMFTTYERCMKHWWWQ